MAAPTIATPLEVVYCEDCHWRPASGLTPIDIGSAIVGHVTHFGHTVRYIAETRYAPAPPETTP